ncbi:hypothetical protein EXIGLDRAFT_761042 [Exidia glandulosa HHB12029]|uniref:Protein kinase domain-containing protein n=1 Tax=Exidia glandulosa HHB12029 TaxID=1314781 RepID=A0A165NVV2_EXIGL|nr:hypothetical protein EXIGLDRAFT_761042 [Exidia glandulosa HHB12029]
MCAKSLWTGERVCLKIVASSLTDPHGQERDILQYLNTEPHRSHPDNPCVPNPIYEFSSFLSLAEPGAFGDLIPCLSIAVMPALEQLYYQRLPTKALYLDVIEQSLRGLAYLHSLGIVHRDLCRQNFVLSTRGPPFRLYFIDFGLVQRYPTADKAPRTIWQGGWVKVPEVREYPSEPYDPFKADIYIPAHEFPEFLLCVVNARLPVSVPQTRL